MTDEEFESKLNELLNSKYECNVENLYYTAEVVLGLRYLYEIEFIAGCPIIEFDFFKKVREKYEDKYDRPNKHYFCAIMDFLAEDDGGFFDERIYDLLEASDFGRIEIRI